MEDPFVALLTLHARELGLIGSTDLNLDKWCASMTLDGLRDSQWLLSYEANVKGWLKSVNGADHVLSDDRFAFLKKNEVSFYDRDKVTSHTPRKHSQAIGSGGGLGGYPEGHEFLLPDELPSPDELPLDLR